MTSSFSAPRPWSALLFCGALIALGQAVQISSGTLHARAIEWLSVGLVLGLAAVVLPSLPDPKAKAERALMLLAGVALAYQLAQLSTVPLGWSDRPFIAPVWPGGLVFAALVGGSGLCERPWLGRFQPCVLVAIFIYLGAWVIRTAPDPFIDVQVFQHDGVEALFAGKNPWALRYRDIYGEGSAFYGEGLSVGGRLQFGFPYPPLSLLLAALGQAIAGDHRYAQLVCAGLTGLIIAHLRPGRVGNVLSALFLFTPRAFLIVEQGWTEPYVVFGLALTVLVARRWPRALPYVLGAFLTVKQYLVVALPLTWLLLAPESTLRARGVWLAKMFGTGALLVLPFALWDLSEFWGSVVTLQSKQPFRPDSLSYLAWWVHKGYPIVSPIWAFLAAVLALALSLWRSPRSPAGFAAAVCFVFLIFFAFNKQAFCNYYYFAIGAFAIAAATSFHGDEPARVEPLIS